MIIPSINEFIGAAREFCSFAIDEREVVPADLWKARALLLCLISNIPAVEAAPQGVEFDEIGPDDATLRKSVARFNKLPFSFYRVVFDPHDLGAIDEPVMGNLADDLSDIFIDLAEGLDLADEGHLEEACFEWSFSYRSHWARHAVNALMAIELHRTDNYDAAERVNLVPSPESGEIEFQ